MNSDYQLDQVQIDPGISPKWKIDFNDSVLLIHDMQKYFVSFLEDKISYQLIENIIKIKSLAKKTNIPIIYSGQRGGMTLDERGLMKDFWGEGMKENPNENSIIKELDENNINFFYKWRYSAFFNTRLYDFIIKEKKKSLIICGIYAHIGILSTTIDALSYDIKPIVIGDAIASYKLEEHSMALDYMQKYTASIYYTKDL